MMSESNINEIEPGDHLCMLYDDEKDKLYTAILFIADGLKKDELILILNEDEEEITKILGQVLDVKRFIERRQLIFLSKDESYLKDGFFDADKMLETLTELDEKALMEGYKGLRIVGNANWVLTYPKVESFFEFEAKLNKFLPLMRSISLCLFDERKFSPDLLLKVLQVHPKLISRKEVRKNLNYLPPDKFLKKLKARNGTLQEIADGKLRREFEEIEEKFKMLFESSFEAVMLFKGDKLVSCNPKAAEILGLKGFRRLFSKKVHDLFDKTLLEDRMKAASRGEPQFFELSFVRPDGKRIELEVSLTKVSDKLMMIARDITERKKMEEKLKESEKKYRQLWENAGDILFIIDLEGNFLEANRTARELFGYSEEELRKLNIRDVVDERYLPAIYQEMEKIINSKRSEILNLEILCYTKDGKAIWIESRAKPIVEGGKVKAIQGIARDVTERKRIENALRESEELFRKLADRSLVGIYLIQDGIFRYVNPKLAKDFGYDVDEIIGTEVLHFIHPEDREIVGRNIEERIKGNIESIRYKPRIIRKDGQVRTFEVFGSRITYQGKPAVIGTAIDITEEEAYKKKLEEYRRFYKNAHDLFFILDSNARFIEVNPRYPEMLGYKKEELIGHTARKFFDPKEIDVARKMFKRVMEGESVRYEAKAIPKDRKKEYIVEILLWPVFENGKIVGAEGIVRDITERKRIENALRENEEMFRTLAEKSLVGIYLIQDGIFKYVNPKMAELWGYDVDELIGKDPLEFIHPEDRETVKRNIEARIKGEIDSINYRLRMVRKDGEIRVNEVYGSRTIYKGKPAVLGTLVDITDEEKRRKKLEQYERFYQNAQDMFFILDDKGRFLDVNPKYAEMLGYSKEELIGHTAKRLIDPNELDMVRDNFKKVMHGESVRYEAKAIARNGKVYIMNVTIWPVFSGGRVVGAEGILRDVTDYVRLNKLLNAINNINKLIVREKNKLRIINETSNELMALGYFTCWIGIKEGDRLTTTSDILKTLNLKNYGANGKKNANCMVKALESKAIVFREGDNIECSRCEFYEKHKELKRYAIPMLVDNEAKGGVVVYSEEILQEEELDLLKTLANDLAFAIRAIEMDELREKAYRQIDKNIENYAILIDHIRNPLAVISGLAEMRVKMKDRDTAEEIVKQVERIEEIIKRLDEGWLESEIIRKFLKGKLRRK